MTCRISDGGMRTEGFKEYRDCAVRALAICKGIEYKQSHELFKHFGRLDKHRTQWNVIYKVLTLTGFKQVNHSSVKTFGQALDFCKTGRYFVATIGHVIAVINGEQWDTYPEGGKRRVLAIWKYETETLETRQIRKLVLRLKRKN